MIEAIWNWCRRSATIAVARVMSLGGVILAILVQMNGDPNFTALLQAFLTPQHTTIALALIGVVVELARRRTAGKE